MKPRSRYLDQLQGLDPGAATEQGAVSDVGSAVPGQDLGGVGLSTDQLSDEELAAMASPGSTVDFDQLQLQQMEAAMNSPDTPPEERAMLQQQLAVAARRRMAGV